MQGSLAATAAPRATRCEIQSAIDGGDFRAALTDIRTMIRSEPSPGNYAFGANCLRQFGNQGAQEAALCPLRTFIVRSVTVEPFLPQILVEGALAGVWLEIAVGGYGSFIDELTNSKGALNKFRPDLVLVLLDVEDAAGDLQLACAQLLMQDAFAAADQAAGRIIDLIKATRQHSGARMLVQGLIVPAHVALGPVADGEARLIRDINGKLAEACRALGDSLLFDADEVAGAFGRNRWRDERLFYSNRLPIATEVFGPYGRALARSIRALCLPAKKVLCTDLDNTLWGGILGEDGAAGIATGAAFPGNCFLAYQQYLKSLSARGVLLAIVSKNNPLDVQEAFRLRKADMALVLEDFAAIQIGWKDKHESICQIAKQLNVGIDSVVFVDDNPVECAQIRQQLPSVTVVEVPADEPWKIRSTITSLSMFDSLSVTDADRHRTQEYKAQELRSQLEATAVSRDDFLRSLGIVVKPVDARDAPLTRTVQLLQKTNQFNLTTKRHTAAEVERIGSLPTSQAIALRYRDSFGDGGVVGVALCHQESGDCVIDTLLLSCRVIGRGVETALLSFIAGQAAANGATRLLGEYVPTSKNSVCADFYPSHGFKLVSSDNDRSFIYQLQIEDGSLKMPDWIAWEV